MPDSKLLLKKIEGQNKERAFSNAHKYFLLLAQIIWRFASHQSMQASIDSAWKVAGEPCPSASMNISGLLLWQLLFLFLTTTVN